MSRVGTLLALLTLLALGVACSVSVRPVDDDPAPTATAVASGRALVGTPTPRARVSPTPRATATAPVIPAEPSPPPSQATPTPTPPPATATRPTATASVDPRVTPTVAPTPMPTPTVTPVPSGPPACAEVPVRGFGLVWHDEPAVAERIGCPLARETGVPARVQQYAQGLMVWLNIPAAAPSLDTAPWVVTLAGGTAARHRVPDPGHDWDPNEVAPTGAFAWVWENVYTDRERLGEVTSAVWASDAALQRFERGMMLWLRDPSDGRPTVYVVEADLATSAYGAFQPFVDRSFS